MKDFVLQMTMKELTNQLSQPVTRDGDEVPSNIRMKGGRKKRKEDKLGLMDNITIETPPPMREEGPKVFIISWDRRRCSFIEVSSSLGSPKDLEQEVGLKKIECVHEPFKVATKLLFQHHVDAAPTGLSVFHFCPSVSNHQLPVLSQWLTRAALILSVHLLSSVTFRWLSWLDNSLRKLTFLDWFISASFVIWDVVSNSCSSLWRCKCVGSLYVCRWPS